MKWFDSLFSKRISTTRLGDQFDIASNQSKKSYQDIDKKRKTISLEKKILRTDKKYSSFLPLAYKKIVSKWSIRQTCVLFIVFFCAFFVYIAGFILRTEKNAFFILDHPQVLLTQKGQNTIRSMKADYQVIGFLVGNPLFPLEPFGSYGQMINALYRIIQKQPLLDLQERFRLWRYDASRESIFPLLEEVFDFFSRIKTDVDIIHDHGTRIVPEIFREEKMSQILSALLKHRDVWFRLFGSQGKTRILLLNQNSDELRAGGGFPGTAFIIEFDEGKLLRFQFYDIYALDWNLRGYRPPPEGINRFRSLEYPGRPIEFEIRDANYYPRFSDSAKKLHELAQEAGVGPIDLVIGINQKIVEDITRLVEPISFPGVEVPVDHKNIILVLSMLVEGKKSSDGTPKSTVYSLFQTLLTTLESRHLELNAISQFFLHVYRGEFIVASPDKNIQDALDDLGIFDRWQKERRGWIYPIFTSISKNKSDRLMERTFDISHRDSCQRSLVLEQKHWFDPLESARIQTMAHTLGLQEKLKTLLFIQGGGDNIQYIRFILPPKTRLLSGAPFSIAEETSSYTSIQVYETTRPGTTSRISLEYQLSEEFCGLETRFFKQPGLRNTRVIIRRAGEKVYQTFFD